MKILFLLAKIFTGIILFIVVLALGIFVYFNFDSWFIKPQELTGAKSGHVVLITIDALSTEDFEELKGMPNFKRLLNGGSYSKTTTPVYPSVTYPNHTSIITGTYPDKHGVIDNKLFEPFASKMPYDSYRSSIKVETLYDLFREKDHKVGSVLWPLTAGADITWNFPEIEAREGEDQTLVVIKNGSPLFLIYEELKYGDMRQGAKQPYLDDFDTQVMCDMILRNKPTLSMIHLVALDEMKHEHGVNSAEAKEQIKAMDERLGKIIKAVEDAGLIDDCTFVVTGDHGQQDAKTLLDLNVEFVNAGLIDLDGDGKVKDYRALVKASGGYATLYFSDDISKDDKDKAMKVVDGYLEYGMIKNIYTNEDLSRMHVYTDASYALEAESDIAFGQHYKGEVIRPYNDDISGTVGGEHGYDSTLSQMQTVTVFSGKGVAKGRVVENMSVVDIAPTIASIFGLGFEDADGSVIEEFIERN